MAESSPDRCEYLWPEDFDPDDLWPEDFDRDDDFLLYHQSCCWRETWREYDRCIWHVETDEEKPAEVLKQDLEEPEDWELNPDLRDAPLQPGEPLDGASLAGTDLSGVEPFFRCVLRGADLTDADLRGADLTDADLRGADLTDAALRGADLTDAAFRGADLTDADLWGVDLINADLRYADLTDAGLWGADLTDADLRGADLINAGLGGATLADVELDQTTQVGRRCPRLSNATTYDELSQSYHELKTAFSDQGLSQRGRDVRFLEQVARRREARKRGQYLTWAGSVLSHGLTRYGTRVWPVLGWTGLVLALPTLWYAFGPVPADGWEGGPLYYSVVTFVTAPPHPFDTSGGWVVSLTQAIILVQTYLGTTLIILLGYVLGTRDRI